MGRTRATVRGGCPLVALAGLVLTLACGEETRATPEPGAPAASPTHEVVPGSSSVSVDQIQVIFLPSRDGQANVDIDVSAQDGSVTAVARDEEGVDHSAPGRIPVAYRRILGNVDMEGAFSGADFLTVNSLGREGPILSRWSPEGAQVQETAFPDESLGPPSSRGVAVWTEEGRVRVLNPQAVEVLAYEALAADPPGTRLESVVLGPRGDGLLEVLGVQEQPQKQVRFRRLDNHQVVWTKAAGPYPSLKFSPDGSLVELRTSGVEGTDEEMILVYQASGTEVGRVNLTSHENPISWFDGDDAVTPDNRYVAVADIALKVWFFEVATGTLVRTWEWNSPHENYRRVRLAFSADQSTLYLTQGLVSR